jgi:hypothetical protein
MPLMIDTLYRSFLQRQRQAIGGIDQLPAADARHESSRAMQSQAELPAQHIHAR